LSENIFICEDLGNFYEQENKNLCPNCNKLIPWKIRHNKFCSKSCSNSHSNKHRKHSKETREKIGKSLKDSEKHKIGCKNKSIRIIEKNNFERVEKDFQCFICKTKFTLKLKPNKNIGRKYPLCDSILCESQFRIFCGKQSASKRNKRSKDEIKLYDLLSLHFNNMSNNTPIVDGWDADIILNDQKIAILWNGPWHYRDMNMSNHSLNQVVNRDILKIIRLEEYGWSVLIYQDNYWIPETALIDVLIKTRLPIKH
jgi:endogenous inhibitor of DNA gyrase (YacG/DUF329 family)